MSATTPQLIDKLFYIPLRITVLTLIRARRYSDKYQCSIIVPCRTTGTNESLLVLLQLINMRQYFLVDLIEFHISPFHDRFCHVE